MHISQAEFLQRRQALLGALPPNSFCVVPAARLQTRSRDTEFPFRQDSDFYYLTGFPEPDAVLLMSNHADNDGALSILFCLPKDKQAEIWQGRRVGPTEAARQYGFDEAYALEHVEDALVSLMDGHDYLYFAQGHDADADNAIFEALATLRDAPKQSKTPPASLCDVRRIIHEMRLIKSEAEQAVMREAARISANAHTRAMKCATAGMKEYQLEAELHHEFVFNGARSPAYGTIVGSGENACILHYTENTDAMQDGDLVLIDAGAELHGYAADITRTFPVSGRFSAPQRALYDLVLRAQEEALSILKPGATLKQATDRTIDVLCEGLIALGLLSGTVEENVSSQAYRAFFMHGLGHWLGLDVHDVGDYKIDGQDRPLKAGMVLTVEPGLYIAPDADVDEQWRGIGIRIEDNILITETGHENLTSSVVKSADEIEALMQSSK
ncbi:Xaa-Pro aminopeptidase [Aestuariibacter sp. AA17]|uniref:Xaa-Pro aminopeptidase n=1 Tax=Fluctibacter corallii TaxID=2984329 RepID=A0ABT3A433_9ALTE|nr:Xaa-Pro aminopeptidase [Aestuariibacter sp. AA17]MCV2883455.1 Xaa-Pro aminopeptidase [Aestuariibacter sp. AA17]